MIYFGDGTTDIPCMKLVKQQGGHSIAVYNPRSRQKRQTMEQLIRDNRVSYICAADYSPDKEIDTLVRTIIDKIHADDRLSKFYRKTEPRPSTRNGSATGGYCSGYSSSCSLRSY